jgi:hypothetical protein
MPGSTAWIDSDAINPSLPWALVCGHVLTLRQRANENVTADAKVGGREDPGRSLPTTTGVLVSRPSQPGCEGRGQTRRATPLPQIAAQ